VPILTSFDVLHHQFNWLIDGEVLHVIEENLVPEIRDMELYLRSEGQEAVIKELDDACKINATFYPDSGDLFKLIGVMRAADIFWNPDKAPVLFHIEGEALHGDGPRILVKGDKNG